MKKSRYFVFLLCLSFISCLSLKDYTMPLGKYHDYYEDLSNCLTYGYKSNFAELDSTSSFLTTGRDLDFAIQEEGFFKVYDEEAGKYYFTRNGQLRVNVEGKAVTKEGYSLFPELVFHFPATISSFSKNKLEIEEKGKATYYEFKLYRLRNISYKENQYYASDFSEEIANPKLWNGVLELSNVKVLSTLLNMIEILDLLDNRKEHARITTNLFILKSLYDIMAERLSKETDAYQTLRAMEDMLSEVIPFTKL